MKENKPQGNHVLEKLEQDHFTIATMLKKTFEQLTNTSQQAHTAQTSVQELYQNLLDALSHVQKAPTHATSITQALTTFEQLCNQQDQHLANLQTNLSILLTTTSLMLAQLHEHEITINHIEAALTNIHNHFTMLDTTLKQAQDYQLSIAKTAHAINDIASKTNLLSINTAIVVEKGCTNEGLLTIAKEIQNLSEQTKFVSDQITKINEQFVVHTAQNNQELTQGIQTSTNALQMIKDYRNNITHVLEHCMKIDQTLQKLLDNTNDQQSTLNNTKAQQKIIAGHLTETSNPNNQLTTVIQNAQTQGKNLIESNTSLLDALQKETDMLKDTQEHVSDFSEKLRTVIQNLHDNDVH